MRYPCFLLAWHAQAERLMKPRLQIRHASGNEGACDKLLQEASKRLQSRVAGDPHCSKPFALAMNPLKREGRPVIRATHSCGARSGSGRVQVARMRVKSQQGVAKQA